MLASLVNAARSGASVFQAAIPLGLKAVKYFIDSSFRAKVTPVPGSVVYCDLWVAVEHSGIYVGNGDISNIEVDGLAEASVCLCGAESSPQRARWVARSTFPATPTGRSVTPSSAKEPGRTLVSAPFTAWCSRTAISSRRNASITPGETSLTIHYGIRRFRSCRAKPGSQPWPSSNRRHEKKLGASKWRLWDWNDDVADNPPPEPDWQAQREHFANQPLDPDSIAREFGAALAEIQAYEEEISDEEIPGAVRNELGALRKLLGEISTKFDETKDFLAACHGASFSYAELLACGDDFSALARQMQGNPGIQELARKMGRDYISEEKKRQNRVPQASRSESIPERTAATT